MASKQEEEDFFTNRSELIGSLITFIKSCQKVDRDITDELDEAMFEACQEANTEIREVM